MTTRLAAFALAVALAYPPANAFAQSSPSRTSESDLSAARALFQDAYRDEQAGRYPDALAKFRRVAVVRESASVRYRIASVLASLGRLRESRDAFRALAASRAQLTGGDLDIADSAAERAQTLDRRIPRVVLKLDAPPPPDARVTIDGAPVPVAVSARRFELDPGEHVVQATAPSAFSSESKVTLAEGGEATVTVVLAPRAGTKRVESSEPFTPTTPHPSPPRGNTMPILALGFGGALVVTGVLLLVARENDVSDIKDACSPTCPTANRQSLESKHDDALLFGPLGFALGGAGLAIAGVGAYFLLRPADGAASTTSASVRVAAQPLAGGALVSAAALF